MGGNGAGVVGVNWNVQIVALKMMGAGGWGNVGDGLAAIDYFTDASISAPATENFVATNNSWGYGQYASWVEPTITRAAQNDILTIAAAGNSASNNDISYNGPSNVSTKVGAGYDAVVAVASLTNVGNLSGFSNYGATTVDLAAPGSNIYSTLPNSGYGALSGTSMATPHVTGAVALYASAHPTATAAEIAAALLATTDATASLANKTQTGGRLDVGNLLSYGSLSSEIGSGTSTTSILVADMPRQSSIEVAGDQDWFKITLAVDTHYVFTLDAGAGSKLNPYLRLLDSTGKEIASNNDAVGYNSGFAYEASVGGTYYISAQGSGTTSGAYILGASATPLSSGVIGTFGNDSLVGSDAPDVLVGYAGNDTLDGGLGQDTMIGGAGNDIYYNDEPWEKLVEKAGEGTDTVVLQIFDYQYWLPDNFENLTLAASDKTAVVVGNELNNVITGNDGRNFLDGGAGADTLMGGKGSDWYYVDNVGDVVIDSGPSSDYDIVKASISYILPESIENLGLGGSDAISGTGNALNNSLFGNTNKNKLYGLGGNDTFYPDYWWSQAPSADTLIGGLGDDLYYIETAEKIVVEAAGEGTDTVIAHVSYTLTANVENLLLSKTDRIITTNPLPNAINGNGNALNNLIWGTPDDNIINGAAGADTMYGGGGNDTYYVDNAEDVVYENSQAGTDSVFSSINYTLVANAENLTLTGATAINGAGNTLDNVITGNAGANIIDGRAGADTMTGLAGNDIYYVDNVGDVVVEAASAGTDGVIASVSYTLAANVENIALGGTAAINGTGNALNNAIIGNSGANIIDGGAGIDTMTGGDGNDTYYVDNVSDKVVESASAGTDVINASVSYTLDANLENLVLMATSAINGTGNALDNEITGNVAANIINGGVGADTMTGGAGDDTYYVDNAADVVVESASSGADTIIASVTYGLSANVENLTLTGTAAINGYGNALNNKITGNTAGNIIDGGAGADTMTGGAANDIYYVDNIGDVVVEAAGAGTDTVF